MPPELTKRSPKEIKTLKPFLDKWVTKIENPDYINDDPVLFMHAFNQKEDQLLAGFFAATMAWGRRDVVIRKVRDFLNRMDNRPADFIANFSDRDAHRFEGFKHRTFKPIDMKWLVKILQTILRDYNSFENFWAYCYQKANENNRPLMSVFHEQFRSFTSSFLISIPKHRSARANTYPMLIKRVPASDSISFCDGLCEIRVP